MKEEEIMNDAADAKKLVIRVSKKPVKRLSLIEKKWSLRMVGDADHWRCGRGESCCKSAGRKNSSSRSSVNRRDEVREVKKVTTKQNHRKRENSSERKCWLEESPGGEP